MVTLPKIERPIFETPLPSNDAKVRYSPMSSRLQKLLLIAKETHDTKEILSAVKQVVINCIADPMPDPRKITLFDLEWLFVKIQSVSVSNKVKLSFRDLEDQKLRDFEVDLDKVIIKQPETPVSNVIAVTDKISMTLHYPYIELYDDKTFLDAVGEKVFDILLPHCIENVSWGSTKIDKAPDLKEWLDTLPVQAYEKCKEFLTNTPTLYYELKYENDQKHERTIRLVTLNDFFMLA